MWKSIPVRIRGILPAQWPSASLSFRCPCGENGPWAVCAVDGRLPLRSYMISSFIEPPPPILVCPTASYWRTYRASRLHWSTAPFHSELQQTLRFDKTLERLQANPSINECPFQTYVASLGLATPNLIEAQKPQMHFAWNKNETHPAPYRHTGHSEGTAMDLRGTAVGLNMWHHRSWLQANVNKQKQA